MLIFRSETRPNQEIERVFHLSRSSLICSNMGGKFALYRCSNKGVTHIPKYTKPSDNDLNGKGDGILGSSVSVLDFSFPSSTPHSSHIVYLDCCGT